MLLSRMLWVLKQFDSRITETHKGRLKFALHKTVQKCKNVRKFLISVAYNTKSYLNLKLQNLQRYLPPDKG